MRSLWINPVGRDRTAQKGQSCEDGGRACSHAAINQGLPGAKEAGQARKDYTLESSEGVWPC